MMKLLTLLFLASLPGILAAQGIDFFHGTFAEALEKAKTEDKLIFVDAFTTWCGPCKRMTSQIFPLKEVGDYYNQNFVNLKLDMEKGEGVDFRMKYGVSSFPTFLFINAEGKVVHKSVGAKPAQEFIEVGKTANRSGGDSDKLLEEYSNGRKDPEFILKLVRSLNKAGKPSLKIVNDYISSQKELGTQENLRIIFEGTTFADSRVFDLLVQNKKEITRLYGEPAVQNRILQACTKTGERAVQLKSKTLLEEAKSKLQVQVPLESEKFSANLDFQFARNAGDVPGYVKAADQLFQNIYKDDISSQNQLIMYMVESFPSEKLVLEKVVKYADKMADKSGLPEHRLVHANLLYKSGDKKAALKVAEKVYGDIKDKNSDTAVQAKNLIDLIHNTL